MVFKKKHRIILKKILLLFLLVLTIILLVAFIRAWRVNSMVQEQRQIQEDRALEYESRIVDLESRIESLGSEQGIEDELIRTLPVKRPGEKVIILVEEEQSRSGGLRSTGQAEDSRWWWPF